MGGEGNALVSQLALDDKAKPLEVINSRSRLLKAEEGLAVLIVEARLYDQQVLEVACISRCMAHLLDILQPGVGEGSHLKGLLMNAVQESADWRIWRCLDPDGNL
jgi:hypothetical protein